MSWFDAIIPQIKRGQRKAKSVPEGAWHKCANCAAAIYEREYIDGLRVCVKCGHHHSMDPLSRAKSLFDDGGDFKEIGMRVRPRDFLKFTDSSKYKERLEKHTGEDKTKEALRAYYGKLGGRTMVMACFDWSFMGGSMGSVVGERFVRGVDVACDRGAPFIVFTASGGARMQEGLTALMQMAKTTAAQAKLSEFGLPFISVLCHPTTGGVAASFAMVADIVIAEPNATIGFAGERVIRSTVGEDLPEGFQRSEFLLSHGGIDMIVDRRQLRETLVSVTSMLMEASEGAL